jgi:hypothetical protein
MQVTTKESEQIWQSPDGQKRIWSVVLETPEGNDYKLKTYSGQVAQPNFKGDVYTYLNPRGERFVRQEKKQPATAGSPGKSGFSRDDEAIKAQWAIGQAINLASVKMDKEAITLPVIERYAKELFKTVSRVKGETLTAEQEANAAQHIERFTQSAAAL